MITRLLVSLMTTLALFASACAASDGETPSMEALGSAAVQQTSTPTLAPVPELTSATPTAVPPTPMPPTPVLPAPEIYDAPGALELVLPIESQAAPGSVIDAEALEIAGAVGQRILYHSLSAQGEGVAVSGFVLYPEGDTPPDGWPLIAWAHGTTGLGDSCAPSNDAENDQLALALVSFGYAVVATDYEGLGTPGTHPYIVGTSEAHSVLDSVRAVHELGLPVTDEWIVFGHSQGGHAAMFTGQLQPTYAPDLALIGVVAGAPPSQMSELNTALIGGDFQGYLIMTAAGLAAADDSLDLGAILSPAAMELIDVVETGCTSEIFDAYNGLDYATATVVDDPFSLPDWAAAIEANDTNLLPTEAPLLIIHGGEDEQVPVKSSATLFEQLCAFDTQGPTIRNVYEGQSHAGVLTTFAAVPDLLAWVEGRFAGEPAPTDCIP